MGLNGLYLINIDTEDLPEYGSAPLDSADAPADFEPSRSGQVGELLRFSFRFWFSALHLSSFV